MIFVVVVSPTGSCHRYTQAASSFSYKAHIAYHIPYIPATERRILKTIARGQNDDFEGGETIFYHTDTWAETHRIHPRTGMALLFDIDLWHSGQPLVCGKKYWIGCEIIGKITDGATPLGD